VTTKESVVSPHIKKRIFGVYDWLSSPFTILAATQLWAIRRYGISNFPIAHQIIRRIGVFPILRHFYEPLFHRDDVKEPLDKERELPGIDFDPDGQLALLQSFDFNKEIVGIFDTPGGATLFGHRFPVENVAFRQGDIELYYNIIRLLKPQRIIEIGSGFSTMVALKAIEANERQDAGCPCEITAVEPYPWFRHEKIKLVDKFVESLDLDFFRQLRENDILFIDSSHMIRPQGDVLFEFLKILPVLAPGVVVHVHDIFTPRDYPDRWVRTEVKFWNEQYLLEAFLSCNTQFRVLIAPNYLQLHHPQELLACCPLLAKKPDASVHSFWMQRRTHADVSPRQSGT
jgi:hypothetical protein